jgi:CubicO group peptidase (beta-lactamase class C family)
MAMGLGYDGDDLTHQEMKRVRVELEKEVGKYTLRKEIKAMAQIPKAFDPGEHWMYGFGHELVAGLIEVTSGMTVGEFLKKEIFEPLGMNSTSYRYFGNIRENMVTVYQKAEDGTLTPMTEVPLEELHEPGEVYEMGGAGLFSTVRDYLAFSCMLACGGSYKGNRIIGRKTIDLMRQNQLTPQQMKEFTSSYHAGYGYGLGVRTMLNTAGGSNTSVGEFGWTGFLGTYTVIDPSERAAVVYMHNLMPNMEQSIHHRVRNTAFGCLR